MAAGLCGMPLVFKMLGVSGAWGARAASSSIRSVLRWVLTLRVIVGLILRKSDFW